MNRFLTICFAALIFSFFSSCTIRVGDSGEKPQGSSSVVPQDSKQTSDDPLSYIGAGDKIRIQVYNEAELSGVYQVSPEGFIMFPFIGEISVDGLNNFSLAAKISEKLKNGYLKDPHVTVIIEEFVSKRIFVLGQVNKAGSFPIRMRMSVIEAISLAGGFTNFADLSNVVVTRKGDDGKEKRFVIDIKAVVNGARENFYLNAGDIIFVGERFF